MKCLDGKSRSKNFTRTCRRDQKSSFDGFGCGRIRLHVHQVPDIGNQCTLHFIRLNACPRGWILSRFNGFALFFSFFEHLRVSITNFVNRKTKLVVPQAIEFFADTLTHFGIVRGNQARIPFVTRCQSRLREIGTTDNESPIACRAKQITFRVKAGSSRTIGTENLDLKIFERLQFPESSRIRKRQIIGREDFARNISFFEFLECLQQRRQTAHGDKHDAHTKR